MKSKIIIIFLALLNFGCNPKNAQKEIPLDNQSENKFFTIKIVDFWKKERDVSISEIADSIQYIPLETSQKSLLGWIINAALTKDFIFIEHSKGPLTQFDRSGKFIRNIGGLGRGPEEYITIREFSIDEEHRRIYIQSGYNRTIQVYSFDGAYLSAIRLPDDFGYIVWSRDSLLMSFEEPTRGTEKFIFEERNSNSEIIQSVKNNFFWENKSKYSYSTGYSQRTVYYRLNNRLHFKDYYNDTVYTYNDKNKIVPKYSIDMGEFKLPDELRIEVTGTSVLSAKYYWTSVKESPLYIFLVYCTYSNNNGKPTDFGLIYFDKLKMNGSKYLNGFGKMNFANDVDGGPDFYPEYVNDSLAFVFLSASEMKRYLKKDDSPNTSSIKQEQKRKLKIKFERLDESDNPVIMIVKLKSKDNN